jgi:hypothetical protein
VPAASDRSASAGGLRPVSDLRRHRRPAGRGSIIADRAPAFRHAPSRGIRRTTWRAVVIATGPGRRRRPIACAVASWSWSRASRMASDTRSDIMSP